ncbi:prepilin-type N-terminal cleavage/methylation domain-containing protein [Deinococcus reticulitermitis]|uniref:Prepilin-type N-terminal cleavage/methylation domain-containing protein n=1 Tax=Deinococcus reticulitermitis TaxID=856736 RepID=A0A1H6Z748_9DEIO|nr:prepilin-type N-terminal cleavage/methylation domain-containing protein [Deinococcus reticulitermitis]SEJ44765.1 prepilin-type N-terminal cleavage/methylation domain-containing protein [Deinococcus reticulitermitis]
MKNAHSGLTLLEVLVSIAIFGMLSIAILGVYPNIFKTNGQTRDDQVVTIQAKRYLEQVQKNHADLVEKNKDKAVVPKKELSDLVLPGVPAKAEVNNYTCAATTADKLKDTAGKVLILRVELKCTRTSAPELKFWIDLGQPV